MKRIYIWFDRFMENRYQDDDLYYFMFKIFLFLLFINMFIKSNIINIFGTILTILILYRFLSKRIDKRKRENVIFLKYRKKIMDYIIQKRNFILDKNHVYRKCYKCKTILKLPLADKIGIKTVKCPECGKKHKFLIFKKQKIEIIRNRK